MKRIGMGLLLSLLCVLAACGPGVRSDLTDTGTPPAAPVLSSLETAVVDVEATALRLRARGSGFIETSTVLWKDQALETTVLSDTELSAVLPMTDAVSWDVAEISVRNETSKGAASSKKRVLPFPIPGLSALSPDSLPAAPTVPVRFTVTGKNFVAGSKVEYRGIHHPATVVSTERIEVELPPEALSENIDGEARFQVQVTRPKVWYSNGLSLWVGNRGPELLGVWPGALSTAGGSSPVYTFLVLYTRNLKSGTQLKWNGQSVSYSVYTGTSNLYFRLPEQARSKAGPVTLTLETPGPDGGVSAPFVLPVVDAPVVHSVVTPWLQVGSIYRSLSIQGEGFGPEVQVLWNDKVIGTHTLSSSDFVSLPVPPEEMTIPGTYTVRVRRMSDGALSAPVQVEVVETAPAPVVHGLEPAVVTVGSSPVRLQVNGVGIHPSSVIQINGVDRVSSPNGVYTISTQLEAADLAKEGSLSVTVKTPGPGGGTSLPLLLKVDSRRPVPQLSELSHAYATAGGGPITLAMVGTGLGPDSVVRWDSSFLTTRWEPVCCGTEYRLVADVPAALLALPTVAQVTVFNPSPGGGLSNALNLAVLAPGSSAPKLSPRTVEAGSADVTLMVEGSGFNVGTFVMVGDSSRDTTYVSSERVTVRLTAAELGSERVLQIRTVTPGGQGSVTSAAQSLHVIAPRTPVLRSVVPGVVSVGEWTPSEHRGIGVLGERFSRVDSITRDSPLEATLDWGDGVYPVQFDYSDYWMGPGLVAEVPGTRVTAPGMFEVSVSRATEGGGRSSSALVNVVAERPVPHVSSVQPLTLRAGMASQVISIFAQGLHATSVVRWNGQALPTVREGGTVRAVVPRALLATPGTARLTVTNAAPGGGESQPVPVAVVE